MNTMQIINAIIAAGGVSALAGLVVSGARYLKATADAKTAQITAGIKNDQVKTALQQGEDAATTAVLELAQTTVDDLKAKAAGGKLTPEQAQQIKNAAISRAMSMLSDAAIQTINTESRNAQAWIEAKIEAAVKKAKSQFPAELASGLTVNVTPTQQTVAAAAQAAAAEATQQVQAQVGTQA